MKKISIKIALFFEKIPVVAYALISLIKSFLIASISITVLYLILWETGVYAKLEAALDLKYNSPIVLAPMWTFVALFVLCLMVGFLMYFHKYKRGKSKTDFYKAIAPALGKK
jgi:hypothetical protein